MRRLIVNADDFGFTSGVNRAIVEAHTCGVVTSSTLMANGTAFDEAIALAKNTPGLSVGCHIVLIDGVPVLDSTQLQSLTDSGRFRDGLKSFAARALAGRMDAAEITAEATAQIRRIQSAGINVSHIDTHKHTHLFPQILKPILRAAESCGVHALRNPFGPRRPFRSSQLLARPNLWTRYAEVRILHAFSDKFQAAVSRAGFVSPNGTLGIEVTGTLDETLFRAIAETIPEGTWEFVCHPGYNDADLRAANTRLRESRETELHVLTLPSARELLIREGIELISYHELANDAIQART
ncbi:MAG TPA: ChbG/HpnK family deacetylase [Candidatus Sulfotelmatobacter sp.]|nr:ChbG/HpnK family deacetylase [Candidatus Sulfotelmatobacter sp.]